MPIQQVIAERLLVPQFQPIVAMAEGRVVGYEALIRGPAEMDLRDPLSLFAAATEAGVLRELERACWSAIIEEVSGKLDEIPRWTRIFLNVLPEDITDPAFLVHVVDELHRTRLDPARIVIEITETTRIDDYAAFNISLAQFRELGFGVAVDDAGAGHAGLQMIAEINPDFLKIDQSLVRGINHSIAKRAGVEALLMLARSLGMTVIAEGIENEDEMRELSRIGVSLGQGFLLAHPADAMAVGLATVPFQLKPSPWAELTVGASAWGARIGELAAPAPTVAPDTIVRTLLQVFETRRASDAIVIVSGGVPAGLVTRSRVRSELARPFSGLDGGLRTAIQIAAEQPLMADCESTLDSVARMATARNADERYDDIIIVRDGKLIGTVSVRRLLEAIADDRVASASHANALTGLAGQPVVEDWIRARLRRREETALVHVDIDSLRIFNNLYGFLQGDRAIRVAADLIASELAIRCNGDVQLGHLGGDDFIAVTDLSTAEHLGRVLPAMFRERASQLYHPEDRARGCMQEFVPDGESRRTPLMSLTVASCTLPAGRHLHYAEMLDMLMDARAVARERSRRAREGELRLLGFPPTGDREVQASPAPSPAIPQSITAA